MSIRRELPLDNIDDDAGVCVCICIFVVVFFAFAGFCMQNLGVVAEDSRDDLGQKRFFPFVPETHLAGGR